jgi:hypothetical protein
MRFRDSEERVVDDNLKSDLHWCKYGGLYGFVLGIIAGIYLGMLISG